MAQPSACLRRQLLQLRHAEALAGCCKRCSLRKVGMCKAGNALQCSCNPV
jgi:hypothetical protein